MSNLKINMSKKILICEDDVEIAKFMSLYLNMKNHPFEVVGFGQDVMPLVKKGEVGLLLLDLGLPDIDGLEVAKQIIEEGYKDQLPIVYFSANARLKKAMEEVPVEDLLTKPFEMEDLDNIIAKYFNRE